MILSINGLFGHLARTTFGINNTQHNSTSAIMLCVVMLNVVILNVVMLIAVMLSVMAPLQIAVAKNKLM